MLQASFNSLAMAEDMLQVSSVQSALLVSFGGKVREYTNSVVNRLIARKGMDGCISFQEFLQAAKKLRNVEVEDMMKQFQLFDSDGSGSIGRTELEHMLIEYGFTPLCKVLDEYFAVINVNDWNNLDFEEIVFLKDLYKKREGYTKAELEEMHEHFDLFDSDNDGILHCNQLSQLMRHRGFDVNVHDLQGLFGQVDFDGNGQLDFSELVRLLRIHREEDLDELKIVFNTSKTWANTVALESLESMLSELHLHLDLDTIKEVKNAQNTCFLTFDAFVVIIDECRKLFVQGRLRYASFSNEEVDRLSELFENIDTSSNGFLQRKEINDVFRRLRIPMKTIDDQHEALSLLGEARRSALRAGVPKEETGSSSRNQPSVTFVVLLHLLRILVEKYEKEGVDSDRRVANELKMSQAEIAGFRDIFQKHAISCGQAGISSWRRISVPEEGESVDTSDMNDFLMDLVYGKRLAVSEHSVSFILKSVGVQFADEHLQSLSNMIESKAFHGGALEFSGFLRVIRWVVDTNFAGANEASLTIIHSKDDSMLGQAKDEGMLGATFSHGFVFPSSGRPL